MCVTAICDLAVMCFICFSAAFLVINSQLLHVMFIQFQSPLFLVPELLVVFSYHRIDVE